jgi:hypothetical protein
MEARPADGSPQASRRRPLASRDVDYGVEVGKLPAEHPGRLDSLAVTDEESRADGHVDHSERLERNVERARRLTVPVGQEGDVDAQGLRPRAVRPRRVAGDPERADAGLGEVVAPVPQEVQLVRSGRRPVPDVEAQEREPGTEYLAQRRRLLARRRPHVDVRNGTAGFEHRATVTPHARVRVVDPARLRPSYRRNDLIVYRTGGTR